MCYSADHPPSSPSGASQTKPRKRIEEKMPRLGDADGVGQAKWRKRVGEHVWEELRRPERYDEAS